MGNQHSKMSEYTEGTEIFCRSKCDLRKGLDGLSVKVLDFFQKECELLSGSGIADATLEVKKIRAIQESDNSAYAQSKVVEHFSSVIASIEVLEEDAFINMMMATAYFVLKDFGYPTVAEYLHKHRDIFSDIVTEVPVYVLPLYIMHVVTQSSKGIWTAEERNEGFSQHFGRIFHTIRKSIESRVIRLQRDSVVVPNNSWRVVGEGKVAEVSFSDLMLIISYAGELSGMQILSFDPDGYVETYMEYLNAISPEHVSKVHLFYRSSAVANNIVEIEKDVHNSENDTSGYLFVELQNKNINPDCMTFHKVKQTLPITFIVGQVAECRYGFGDMQYSKEIPLD